MKRHELAASHLWAPLWHISDAVWQIEQDQNTSDTQSDGASAEQLRNNFEGHSGKMGKENNNAQSYEKIKISQLDLNLL